MKKFNLISLILFCVIAALLAAIPLQSQIIGGGSRVIGGGESLVIQDANTVKIKNPTATHQATTIWNAATEYSIGMLVTDPANGLVYRWIKKTAEVSATAPNSDDGSRWVADAYPLEGNLFIGDVAGNAITTLGAQSYTGSHPPWAGKYNTFIGLSAGPVATNTDFSTFIGYEAGHANTNGDQNTFIGGLAGRACIAGYHNCYVGAGAGEANVTGYFNTVIGCDANLTNTSGHNCVVVGTSARTGTGATTTMIGSTCGHATFSGAQTVSVGYANLLGASGAADCNTILGCGCGQAIVGADNNTLIGWETGKALTGNNNICLGYRAGYKQVGISNKLYIDNIGRANDSDENNMSLIVGLGAAAAKDQRLQTNALFKPVCQPTTDRPSWSSALEGYMYYDTTLHKLVVAGESAWETVTSTAP